MSAIQRRFDLGSRLGERRLREIGTEFRDARLTLGISQDKVAQTCRMSRSKYSRAENGRLASLSILDAARISAALGLDLSARVYPGGEPLRDAGQAKRLMTLLRSVAPPLRYVTEAPLPTVEDRPERRAWDALLLGHGERTAIELETRLHDAQAQARRIRLKQRDDPPDQLLVVVADTPANRRVLATYGDLFTDWPRLRTASVARTLAAGHHPPQGLILI